MAEHVRLAVLLIQLHCWTLDPCLSKICASIWFNPLAASALRSCALLRYGLQWTVTLKAGMCRHQKNDQVQNRQDEWL